MQFYYAYVLLSEKDNLFYTGYTKNLTNRIGEKYRILIIGNQNGDEIVNKIDKILLKQYSERSTTPNTGSYAKPFSEIHR